MKTAKQLCNLSIYLWGHNMGQFSELDIENRERAETIGVSLDDNRTPPRFFRLLDIPAHMGVIYCEPLDDIGNTVPIVKSRFWALT